MGQQLPVYAGTNLITRGDTQYPLVICYVIAIENTTFLVDLRTQKNDFP